MKRTKRSIIPFESSNSGLQWLGKSDNNGFICKRKDGGYVYAYPVEAENTGDERPLLDAHCWTSALPSDLEPLTNSDKKFIDECFGTYIETLHCGECGKVHDSEDYQPNYTVRDCEVYCIECVPEEQKLKEVCKPEDVFEAYRIEDAPKGFEEVETLFCDSSGFGASYEAALTKAQTIQRMKELLREHGTLYAGLTGVGQFQVYVTLYKKTSKRSKRGAK